MTPHEPRTLGYYAASHWFQSAVIFVLLAVLALVLLRALDEAEIRAERQAVELTVRNMRAGLQYAMSEALMHQQESEIAAWEGSDPTRWLQVRPAGYRGACTSVESKNLPEGAWCFERDGRRLVYRPRALMALHGPENELCKELSWRVARVDGGAAHGGFIGVRIEPASGCGFADAVKK